MRRFGVVGVRVGLDAAERLEGVFGIVILLGKEGVNKLLRLLKLERRSRALEGLDKVDSRVPYRYIAYRSIT